MTQDPSNNPLDDLAGPASPHASPPSTGKGNLWRAIGPCIVYAGAAIGVSHLVQSTRAGAGYGFTLVWAVLLVCVCKYPFFEFAQRYTASTGENIIAGYRRVGWWALAIFTAIAFLSAMPNLAVLALVTSGLATQIFELPLSVLAWSGILIGICVSLLAAGGYPWLDRLMKLMMIFLAICTLVTVVAAAIHGANRAPGHEAPTVFTPAGMVFLIALMGWMPTPVDVSVWPSLWMEARAKQTGHQPSLREALFDFNLGYFTTTVMALLFLAMGALVMFGTGETMPDSAPAFAGKLVQMYTTTLGAWARWFVVIAAFACVFSTTLTVVDAYPRVLAACVHTFRPLTHRARQRWYWLFIALLAVTSWVIIWYSQSQAGAGKMKGLIDFVTVLAFLSAPLLAFINWRVAVLPAVPADARPPRWLQALAWAGMLFLLGFSGWYIYTRIGA